MTRMLRAAAAIPLTTLLLLTGCGSGTSTTVGGPPTVPASANSLTASQLSDIRQCLNAAGIHHGFSTSSPGGGLSGTPIARPTGGPSDGGPGGLPYGGIFDQHRVVKALRLCQIRLPQIASPG
jgi:hypothetical protein